MGPIIGQSAQSIYQAFERFSESSRALSAPLEQRSDARAVGRAPQDAQRANVETARETDRVNAAVGLVRADAELRAAVAVERTRTDMTQRLLDIRV
jgi:replication initiation and membrane attachment protein DnaB